MAPCPAFLGRRCGLVTQTCTVVLRLAVRMAMVLTCASLVSGWDPFLDLIGFAYLSSC
jgi:hypothetical protein